MTILRRALPVIWLAALITYVLAAIPDVPFHGDESTQIYMSRDYDYLFIARTPLRTQVVDFDNPTSATEMQLRLLNGTVSKLLIGLAWHSAGYSVGSLNEQWDWGADWNYNQQFGHAPNADLLRLARLPSAILLAAGVVLMFLLGRTLGGGWVPYAASLYYALNPALLLNGRRAMMEGSFIAFSLLAVLAAVWLFQRPSWLRTLLLGLAAGLALASKHTALFTVAIVFLTGIGYLIWQSVRSRDDSSPVEYLILPLLITAALVTIGTFLLLNPAWWFDPLGRISTVWQMRQDLLAGQTAAFGGYPNLGEQLVGFLRQTLIVQPQYFEVAGWDQFIGGQISAYEALPWRGVSVGGSVLGAVIWCAIIGLGGWRLIRDRAIDGAARWTIGLWALTMALTTALLTPIEWQRYYLPVYPAVGLIGALGVQTLIQRLAARLR